MCDYQANNVTDANAHALQEHDCAISKCFKRNKKKVVKKKKKTVQIDTRTILDHMKDLKELLFEETFCIPMSKEKRPLCKYKVDSDLTWNESYDKAKAVDEMIVDSTPMYGVRCSNVCLVDVDLDKAGVDIPAVSYTHLRAHETR